MKGPARVDVPGLADFGYQFACELHRLRHEVLAVDSDQDRVQQILPHVTKAAVADVTDRVALDELGIASFDIATVCVGQRLETAVSLVHHLRRLESPRILVKIANDEQAEIMTRMGATEVVQPDQNAAHQAAILINHPRAISFLELGGGQLIVTARPPSSLVGQAVDATPWLDRYSIALLAVWQAGQQNPPLLPAPAYTIAETDILILAGHIDRRRELRRLR